MKFVSQKSGYQKTSTRSSIVNTTLTKSTVVKFLHLIGCFGMNAVTNGIKIIINIYALNLVIC